MGWRLPRNEAVHSSARAPEGQRPLLWCYKRMLFKAVEKSHLQHTDSNNSLSGPHLSEQKVFCSSESGLSGTTFQNDLVLNSRHESIEALLGLTIEKCLFIRDNFCAGHLGFDLFKLSGKCFFLFVRFCLN